MKNVNKCYICNKQFKKSPSFVSHIKIKHDITKQQYLEKFGKIAIKQFEYNIKRTDGFKKAISKTKKINFEAGVYDLAYLKNVNIKRSKKYVEKLNAMSCDEKKEFLKHWQESGSKATAQKWKIISDFDRKVHFKNIFGDRYREDTILVCTFCSKEFTRKTSKAEQIKKNNKNFCSKSCSSTFFTINKSIIKKSNLDGFRSLYESEFKAILDELEYIDNILYESFYIEFIDKDGKKSRYIPDFKIKTNFGKIYIIEVGSLYLKKLDIKNFKLKTKAAIKYCKKNNWKYLFVNDVNLKLGNKSIDKQTKKNKLKRLLK